MIKKIEQYSDFENNKEFNSLEDIDIGKKNIKKLQGELENLYDDIRIKFEKEKDQEKKEELLKKSDEILSTLKNLKKDIDVKKEVKKENKIPKSLKSRDLKIAKNILKAKKNLENIARVASKDRNFIASLAGKGLEYLQKGQDKSDKLT